MADISQVKLPNGDTYNLVDETSGYIKNYTETDPVFSASAAAGITSTDISNWNSKADIYDITAGVGSSGNSSKLNIVLSNYYGNYEYKNFMMFVNKSQTISSSTIVRTTTNTTDNQLEIQSTHIILNGKSNPPIILPGLYYGTLSAWSNSATLTLISAPTMADIPQVYSSTNTGGYLTMATLPIYDGTVV